MRKDDLPSSQKRLLKLMQSVNFGRIEQLVIRNGQPIFDPPPRVVREIKLGTENSSRPETALEDFVLKKQVRDLFDQFLHLNNATVRTLVIQNGLPIRMSVEEDAA